MPPLAALRRLFAARRTGRPPGIILLYHRVATNERDPFGLDVSPEHFAQHLEVLERAADVVPLAEVGHGRQRRTVAITFDDGYVDNLRHAAPQLASHGFAATLFAVSGAIGSRREFWWDRLERCLLEPSALPRTLSLELGGEIFEAKIEAHDFAPQSTAWRQFNLYGGEAPTPRHDLLRQLVERLAPCAPVARDLALGALGRWAAVDEAARDAYRPLDADELCALTRSGDWEIGAHTRGHPILSRLTPDAQRDEIGSSLRDLAALVACPVTRFAYPHGGPNDYDSVSVAAAREAGFVAAYVNIPGTTAEATEPFELPRCLVHDCDGAELERRLERWFET